MTTEFSKLFSIALYFSAFFAFNVSASTYNLTKDDFKFTSRGKINAKNKGEIDMHFVEKAKL
jgi:hypothetical protein